MAQTLHDWWREKMESNEMCLALATYGGRIASLLDTADKFVIIQSPPYDIKNSTTVIIKNNSPQELLQVLKDNKVNILICGAITGCMRQLLEAQHIRVFPWVTGKVQDVVAAFRTENLLSPSFIMPGGRGRKRHRKPPFKRGGGYCHDKAHDF